MRRTLWIACLGWLLVPRTAAAEVVPLERLEALALAQQPTIEAAHARLAQAEAQIARARSAYNPRLALVAEGNVAPGGLLRDLDTDPDEAFLVQGSPSLDSDNRGTAFLPQPRYGLGLELSSTLYDFGRTGAAVDAARAQRDAARAETAVSERRVVQAVRGAYVAWTTASHLAQIADTAARQAEERTGRVKGLIEEGVRPPADLAAARVDEKLAQLEAARARAELGSARDTLEQAVGSALPPDAAPDPGVLSAPTPEAAAQPAPDPAALALQRQQSAAEATARMHEHGDSPVLAGNVSAGARGQFGLRQEDENAEQRYRNTLFPTYVLGVSFSMPLWDGGASEANAAVARAQARELAARVMEQRQEADRARARTRAELAQAEARLAIAEELLAVAAQRREDVEAEYRLGGGSMERVADALALLQRAQREVALARAARADAILRLTPL